MLCLVRVEWSVCSLELDVRLEMGVKVERVTRDQEEGTAVINKVCG